MEDPKYEPWNSHGEQTENNYGGHTVDNEDPDQGYVDEDDDIQMGYSGQSFDDDDPIQGYVDPNDPEKMREAQRMLEEQEAKEQRRREGQRFMALGYEPAKTAAEEKMPKEVEKETAKEVEKEPTEQDETLHGVFERALAIRDRYKEPGRPSYRLLSVGAAEMKRVEQEGDAKEIVERNNQEIEKAVKTALGSEELDEHAKQVLASIQLYISEGLIGNDSESVSVGATETIVNQNGEIGKDSEKYKNLVVVRWIKNSINHVVAFSPRKDAAIYALVDDSALDSWRDTFVAAGAVAGSEREAVSITRHEQYVDNRTHEKTIEKCMIGILTKETQLLASDSIEPKQREKMLNAIKEEYEHLFAYYGASKELGATPPVPPGGGDSRKSSEDSLDNGDANAGNEDE